MSCAIYGKFIYTNPQCMRSRIVVDAGLLRSLVSFRQMKPTTVASFQLKGYVWLAVLVDPTR